MRLPFVAISAWLAAQSAAAHHVVSQYGIAFVEPQTTFELDVQAAGIEREGRRGSWQLVAPAVEYALWPWLSLSVRVPVARTFVAGSHAHQGLGDVEVGAKLALHSTPHGELLLSAGLGVELPTGDTHGGLGSGHLELAPFLVVSTARAPFVLFGSFSPRLSIDSGHAHEHGDAPIIAPHAARELGLRAGVAWVPDPAPYYLSLGAEAAVSFDEGPWGTAATRAEVGYRLGAWRLAMGFDLPVAGEERFAWRTRAGLIWIR